MGEQGRVDGVGKTGGKGGEGGRVVSIRGRRRRG